MLQSCHTKVGKVLSDHEQLMPPGINLVGKTLSTNLQCVLSVIHKSLKTRYVTHKPAFFSLPLYHMILQTIAMPLKDISKAKQGIFCSNTVT
jgi:hypothetical protein